MMANIKWIGLGVVIGAAAVMAMQKMKLAKVGPIVDSAAPPA